MFFITLKRHGFCPTLSPANWVECFHFVLPLKKTNKIRREKEISKKHYSEKNTVIPLILQDLRLHGRESCSARQTLFFIFLPPSGQKSSGLHSLWWEERRAGGSELAEKICDESWTWTWARQRSSSDEPPWIMLTLYFRQQVRSPCRPSSLAHFKAIHLFQQLSLRQGSAFSLPFICMYFKLHQQAATLLLFCCSSPCPLSICSLPLSSASYPPLYLHFPSSFFYTLLMCLTYINMLILEGRG